MADVSRPLPALARHCIAGGAILMLVGVVLGAFGAHALQSHVSARQLASFATGVHYHLLHALGLAIVGLVACVTRPGAALRWSARLMAAGIVLFCGSIYLMTAGAPRGLGLVAPVGGTSFMLAWLLLAWHVLAGPRDGRDRGPGTALPPAEGGVRRQV